MHKFLILEYVSFADGRIDPIFEARLRSMGAWLQVNGEAIYGSRPFNRSQNDTVNPLVYFTRGAAPKSRGQHDSSADPPPLYAIVLQEGARFETAERNAENGSGSRRKRAQWIRDASLDRFADADEIAIGAVNANEVASATLLGYSGPIQIKARSPNGLLIVMPQLLPAQAPEAFRYALVFKFTGVN